jgi:hypothetical protein
VKKASSLILLMLSGLLWIPLASARAAAMQAPAAGPAAKALGDVTQLQPGHMTLHTEKGDVQVVLPEGVRVLRGSQDLKTTTPITVGDIVVGDRALVLGRLGDDQQTIQAARVVVMTKADISGIHEAEVKDWQTRGIEGVVKAADADKLQFTIAVPNRPPTPGNLTHPVTLTTTAKTVFLRYAPNSIKFADAQQSNFAGIKIGDQLRALGTASEDKTRYTADKIVSGTFHNIGATVLSVDAASNTLTVKNLSTNKPIIVHTNADCQMRQLSDSMAQRIAGLSTGTIAARPAGGGPPAGGGGGAGNGEGPRGGGGGPGGGGMGRGMGNFNQALEFMPTFKLADLTRGEPVVIFSSEGTSPSEVTALYILTGVEPILAAQPKGGGDVNLGSWNLSSGGGGGDAGGGGP